MLVKINKMRGLPVNVVNLICEWAAQDDIDWYPFFCSKTHKLSWKVNKHSRKFIENGNIILHNRLDSYVIEGIIDIHNGLSGEYELLHYKGILFKFIDCTFNLYIEIDTETDNTKKDKFMYRAMLSFDGSPEGGLLRTNPNIIYDLYLNGTCYGVIYDAWINYHDNNRMGLLIENY
jgi:hypothetical protein